jgi:Niemann-Pick C1 protein
MLNRLSKDLSLPRQLLSRCPACYRNFRTFLCDMTCSPIQSQFHIVNKEREYNPNKVDPSESANSEPDNGNEHDQSDDYDNQHFKKRTASNVAQMEITEITYTISEYFVNRFFDSCKDVKYTAANQRALDILCSDSQCTPIKLVTFIGNNKYAPFVFNINMTDSAFYLNETVHIIPSNSTVYNCNAAINSTNYKANACGCSDCKPMCPLPPKPDIEVVCYISGIECFSFGIFAAYAVFFVSFVSTLILFRKRSKHTRGLVEISPGNSFVNQSIKEMYSLYTCLFLKRR